MKVRFRTNLGSRDAIKFGLDHEKCSIDSEHEFNEDLALSLASLGLVEIDEASKKVGQPVSVKIEAVPDDPAISESMPSEIAGDQGIGVNYFDAGPDSQSSQSKKSKAKKTDG